MKPETVIAWHRKGFRLLWTWKSRRRGRPQLSADIRSLIRTMSEARMVANSNGSYPDARLVQSSREHVLQAPQHHEDRMRIEAAQHFDQSLSVNRPQLV